MTKVEVFAPAKINLSLHITGRRADGYHLLDSLVAFATIGDRLRVEDARETAIVIDGPEATGVPADGTNLAFRAAMLTRPRRRSLIALTKCLPPASGIGGGSADAAAAVRACLPGDGSTGVGPKLRAELLRLGADIPMCLSPAPARVRGIGEKIIPVALPVLPAVLVNPRVPLATGDVFAALKVRDNPSMPDHLPGFVDASGLIAWLANQRNDLEPPARAVAPAVSTVLDAIAATPDCGLARMSGSGATCFGLYETEDAANAAARKLAALHPGWWIRSCTLGDMSELAAPRPL